MREYHLYFWEPMVSPHKNGFFAALAREPAVASVTQIADQALSHERKALGWSTSVMPGVRAIVSPAPQEIRDIVHIAPADAIHIFSGIRWIPTIVAGLAEVMALGRRFGIMHEPRVWHGVSGLARLAQSWTTERRIRRRIDFVLGIGRHGPTWFRLAGYGAQRVFPFAYFLDFPPFVPPEQTARADGVRTVGYVGRLSPAKGFGIFAEAVEHVAHPIEVRMAGAGEMEAEARSIVARFGPARASYSGAIPITEVSSFLAELDVLVVPSLTKDDGWGAVVGEALAAGTSVIASEHVGASVCLMEGWNGRALPAISARTLAAAINELCASPIIGPEYRAVRARWARSHVSAQAGARYLMRIIRYLDGFEPRPAAFYQVSP